MELRNVKRLERGFNLTVRVVLDESDEAEIAQSVFGIVRRLVDESRDAKLKRPTSIKVSPLRIGSQKN